jgi:hypothetical protein
VDNVAQYTVEGFAPYDTKQLEEFIQAVGQELERRARPFKPGDKFKFLNDIDSKERTLVTMHSDLVSPPYGNRVYWLEPDGRVFCATPEQMAKRTGEPIERFRKVISLHSW